MYNAENYAGRAYEYGVSDCYTLIQEWFKNEGGVTLADYPRPTTWFQESNTLFREGFPKEGFRVIDIPFSQLEPGDLLFCAISMNEMNHCAVYVGEGKILHHLAHRLSAWEPLNRLIRNTCVAIVRHPQLQLEKPVMKKVDLNDLDPNR